MTSIDRPLTERPRPRQIAVLLADLYEKSFGGRERGRYRISMKNMRTLTGRRRVPTRYIAQVAEELYELGYILIDMETFFVVLGQRTFQSYRRVSEVSLLRPNKALAYA